jgi:hypothetical protein
MTVRIMLRRGRELHRHAHDLAVAHAALGDDMLAKLLHVGGLALEHRDLEAGIGARRMRSSDSGAARAIASGSGNRVQAEVSMAGIG